jgi:hypothetical protein
MEILVGLVVELDLQVAPVLETLLQHLPVKETMVARVAEPLVLPVVVVLAKRVRPKAEMMVARAEMELHPLLLGLP